MSIDNGFTFFCSWSGGKDSCLSLYRTLNRNYRPGGLLTMFDNAGSRSRAHNIPLEVIKGQALSLGIPLTARAATWEGYRDVLSSVLRGYKAEGMDTGVFGDIDLEDHRVWIEEVCAGEGVTPLFPLWQEKRQVLLGEFLKAGFKTMIIAVKEDVIDTGYLGRVLDREVVNDFQRLGIDLSGEKGEYHTVVTDGPLFSFPLKITPKGVYTSGGYSYLDVSL